MERILDELRARDAIDSARAIAPLRAAPGAHVIRTDGLTVEEAVARVVAVIESTGPVGGG